MRMRTARDDFLTPVLGILIESIRAYCRAQEPSIGNDAQVRRQIAFGAGLLSDVSRTPAFLWHTPATPITFNPTGVMLPWHYLPVR